MKNGLFREIGRFVCFVLFFLSRGFPKALGFKLKQNHNHTSPLWGRVHVHPWAPFLEYFDSGIVYNPAFFGNSR